MHLSRIKKIIQANWVLIPPLFNVQQGTQLRVLSGLLETHFGEFLCCGRTGGLVVVGLTGRAWGISWMGYGTGASGLAGGFLAGWDEGPISH